MTEDQLELVIEDAIAGVDEIAEDTEKLTIEESIEVYDGVADHCRVRIRSLREEAGMD